MPRPVIKLTRRGLWRSGLLRTEYSFMIRLSVLANRPTIPKGFSPYIIGDQCPEVTSEAVRRRKCQH